MALRHARWSHPLTYIGPPAQRGGEGGRRGGLSVCVRACLCTWRRARVQIRRICNAKGHGKGHSELVSELYFFFGGNASGVSLRFKSLSRAGVVCVQVKGTWKFRSASRGPSCAPSRRVPRTPVTTSTAPQRWICRSGPFSQIVTYVTHVHRLYGCNGCAPSVWMLQVCVK